MASSTIYDFSSGRSGLLSDSFELGTRLRFQLHEALSDVIGSRVSVLLQDGMIARTCGLLTHLASQLMVAPANLADPEACYKRQLAVLASLIDHQDLVVYCHALALEYHQIYQLKYNVDLDLLLSPMMQDLVTSSDQETAQLAAEVLASQMSFLSDMTHMRLLISNLPSNLVSRLKSSICGIVDVYDIEEVPRQKAHIKMSAE